MRGSELLLVLSLITVAIVPFLSLLVWKMRQESKMIELLVSLHSAESSRVQTLMNLTLSRDFQTFAGLQSLSNPLNQLSSQQTTPSPNSTFSSNPDYIPRDDVTEANRIKAFGGGIGYGEVIFEDDQSDEELKQAISEMVANGQVEFEEGLS